MPKHKYNQQVVYVYKPVMLPDNMLSIVVAF